MSFFGKMGALISAIFDIFDSLDDITNSGSDGGPGRITNSTRLQNKVNAGFAYDPNLFYDHQFFNDKLCWQLYAANPESEEPTEDDLEPILRGILQDTSFEISGHNKFSTGDSFGLSSLGKEAVSMLNRVSESGKVSYALNNSLIEQLTGKGIQGNFNQGVDQLFNGGTSNSIKWGFEQFKNMLGSHYVTAFDHVKVFQGTDLEFNFPALTTRIYHNQLWDPKTGAPMPVIDVLASLTERFIGDFDTLGDGKTSGNKTGNTSVANMFGVQRPPNGYEPKFTQLINTINKGSFSLEYGGYKIHNLLITNFTFKLSTMKVLTGSSENPQPSDDPLFVDVSLTIQPCNFISKETLKNILRMTSKK